MAAEIEQLEAKLVELQGERATLEATLTHEDLVRRVDEWLQAARARAERFFEDRPQRRRGR